MALMCQLTLLCTIATGFTKSVPAFKLILKYLHFIYLYCRCYACDDEILLDKHKKVAECMEQLKKMAGVPPPDAAGKTNIIHEANL